MNSKKFGAHTGCPVINSLIIIVIYTRSMKKLSENEVKKRLLDLDDWDVVDGKLCKEYMFKDFKQAFSFMNELAIVINKMDHHPEWLNTYNMVSISLSTHSADGISELDFKLAQATKQIAGKYLKTSSN